MTLGTAKITTQGNLFIVDYMNIGSCLRCEPRAFHTEPEAIEFCRQRGLRVVS